MFWCILLISAYLLHGISGHVKVVSVGECPDFASEIEGVSLTTHYENSIFDANFSVPFNLDEDVNVIMLTHKKDGNNWIEAGFEMKADFCHVMDEILSTVWSKAIELMKIPKPCPIKKGTYSLKGLSVTYKEFALEISEDKSEYLLRITFSKDDKNFACREVGVLITED